jgi:hypothetical protein
MKPIYCLPALVMVFVLVPATHAESRWIDDTLIAPAAPGIERVVVDVKENNSVWYALVSGNHTGDQESWYTSADGGVSWAECYHGQWSTDDVAIGGAYGFGVLLQVWHPFNQILWYQVVDATSCALIRYGYFTNEYPRKARNIVVDSNAESGPGQVFIACANLVDAGTGQATLKAYRTTDLGLTWGDFWTLDQGPAGEPDYFGDIDLSFSVAGYPYFHLVYEKGGRLWHVRTTDAGASWGTPTELIVNVNPAGGVGVSAFGVYGIAVGESPSGQVVYCNTTNAGASWSNAKLIDDGEGVVRLPAVSCRSGLYHVVYRKNDGRLAERHTTNPDDPANWSAEEYASLGTTDLQPSIRGVGGANAGVVYARRDDGGRPYFVSRAGIPGAVDHEQPLADAKDLVVFPTPSTGLVTVVYSGREGSRSVGGGESGAVVDIAGRLVRTLRWSGAEGRGIVSGWDGRDAAGRLVPPGVYYVRLSTPTGVRSAPLLIVR